MRKFIVGMIIIVSSISVLNAIELHHNWIKKNYNYISHNEDQLKVAKQSYNIGNALIIKGEKYGKTLAAIALIESSLGRDRIGDHGTTFGLTHFSLDRAREIIAVSSYLNGMKNISDNKLSHLLKNNDEINMILCGLNFKMNLAKFHSYSKAIRAHNGYIPGKFSNLDYYEKIVNAMRVIEKLKKYNLI